MIQLSMACKKCRFLRQQGAKAIFFSWGSVFLGIAGTPRNSYCIFSKYENNSLWSYVLRARLAGGPGQRHRHAPAAGSGGAGPRGGGSAGAWYMVSTDRVLSSRDDMQAIRRAWNVAPRGGRY